MLGEKIAIYFLRNEISLSDCLATVEASRSTPAEVSVTKAREEK